MARRIRTVVNTGIYRTILTRLTSQEQEALLSLLQQEEASLFTAFNRIKEVPKSATLTHLDEWLSRLTWLQSLGNMQPKIEGIRSTKIIHLAEEARSLHASDFSDFLPPKRFAFLVRFIHQVTMSTRDQIVEMLIKRMSKLTTKAKEELERLQTEERTTTEHLIEVFTDVLQTNTETQDVTEAGKHIREVIEREGGTARLLEQCEQVSAHHGDRYQPLVWRFYSSHRKALFRVIKTLDLRSTTSDQTLIDAMNFIIAHEHDTKKYVEATINLSFASVKWQRTVIRYGGFGGIAYHHVSDMYLLLFSHFVACGVQEAIYILDILMRNQSTIKPTAIHADTHGQNLPVFGLSYLLGVELMPRIRNWKDLKFYRSSKETHYEHIDSLFGDNVVDWELIKTHWQDLLRVVISIQEGKVLPSMLLRKLTTYSRKNRLYQAFHALGTVVRTTFLLTFISDVKLREVIHRSTNKAEEYHNFEDWITFASGGIIRERACTEQEKRIKYTGIFANCIMLDNMWNRPVKNY